MTDITIPATAAETLARAFHDDPVFRWWIPDDEARRGILPAFFDLVTRGCDEVHATEGADSVAVWNRPGAEDDDEAADALAAIAGDHAERLFTIFGLQAEHHPAEPHWYLFFLATRPGLQSRGRGSELIRPVLETCDAEGVPAYLEATSERSRALYERHGFEVTGEIRLPDGPSLWPMRREARQSYRT
jgi:ribosomal protein S18 acetylase RimI-like enzyme